MGRELGETGCVRWPSGEPWHDSGEGGLWVYAFWKVETVPASKPMYDVRPGDEDYDELVDVRFEYERDPFVRCIGPDSTILLPRSHTRVAGPDKTIVLPLPDVVSDDPGQIYYRDFDARPNWGDEDYDRWHLDAGVGVLAAVCLGTSGPSWCDADGNYWACTDETLTENGRQLLAHLDALYSRGHHFVTYLDT